MSRQRKNIIFVTFSAVLSYAWYAAFFVHSSWPIHSMKMFSGLNNKDRSFVYTEVYSVDHNNQETRLSKRKLLSPLTRGRIGNLLREKKIKTLNRNVKALYQLHLINRKKIKDGRPIAKKLHIYRQKVKFENQTLQKKLPNPVLISVISL